MTESVALFGSDRSMVGVLSRPVAPAAGVGVVILGAGRVHRTGPHRLHVALARRLAARGFHVARFDLPGIGDSPARRSPRPENGSMGGPEIAATREVVDRLAAEHQLDRFVLMGLCSGGALAFQAALSDHRVVGVVPINPYHGMESEEDSFRRDGGLGRFYATTAIRDPDRWRRFLTGRSNYGRILATARGALRASISVPAGESSATEKIEIALATLADRGVSVLAIFGAGDASLGFLRSTLGSDLDRLHGEGLFQLAIIPRSDHTFTLENDRRQLLERVESWLVHLIG